MEQTKIPNASSAGAALADDNDGALDDFLMKVVEARARGVEVAKSSAARTSTTIVDAALCSVGDKILTQKNELQPEEESCQVFGSKIASQGLPKKKVPPTGLERRRPGAYSISGSDVEDACEGSRTDTDTTADSLLPEEESISEITGTVISNAHLVSEPPDEFNNCQVCMVACDGGGGWAACKDMCVPDATFSCQSDTMGKFKTIQEYTDFMALFGKACPNPTWTTDASSWDGVSHTATFFCTYYCTHTVSVDGVGPSTPTQRSAVSNYCCMVKTDPDQGNRIVHITKVWNDVWMLKELGWITEAVADQNTTDDDIERSLSETEEDTGTSADVAVATAKPIKERKQRKKIWKMSLASLFTGKEKTSV